MSYQLEHAAIYIAMIVTLLAEKLEAKFPGLLDKLNTMTFGYLQPHLDTDADLAESGKEILDAKVIQMIGSVMDVFIEEIAGVVGEDHLSYVTNPTLAMEAVQEYDKDIIGHRLNALNYTDEDKEHFMKVVSELFTSAGDHPFAKIMTPVFKSMSASRSQSGGFAADAFIYAQALRNGIRKPETTAVTQ